MQENHQMYTSREDVERLLRQTLESTDKQDKSKGGSKKKATPGKIARRVIYGVVLVSLLFMLGKVWLARLTGGVPSLFGYQMYVVETGSMIPTLPVGCTIVVRELREGDALSVGDIVTYAHESAVITHRITQTVVGKDGVTRYQTQGDNPDNSADPWLVERESIRGIVVWHVSLNLLGQ